MDELSPRERELLKIRRDSDTKAAQLLKMEKLMQQTKDLMDKRGEPDKVQENMGAFGRLSRDRS